MDGYEAMEKELAALKRIAGLLLSLANLAEDAAGRSPAIRALVLFILVPGLYAARRFVLGSDAPGDWPRLVGDSPAQARLMAQLFRELACELYEQVLDDYQAWAETSLGQRSLAPPPRRDAAGLLRAMRAVVSRLSLAAAIRPALLDTS